MNNDLKVASLDVEDNEWRFTEIGREIYNDRPNDRNSYIDAVREGFKLYKSLSILPKQEEDIDWKIIADQVFNDLYGNTPLAVTSDVMNQELLKNLIIAGYKTASKKWSDEDMKYFAKKCAIEQLKTSEQVNKAFESLYSEF